MKHTQGLLLFLLFCVLTPITGSGATDHTNADDVAYSGLKLLAQALSIHSGLASHSNVRPEDIKLAKLGPPLRVFYVSMEKLSTFTPLQNPTSFSQDGHSFLYPVSLSGKLIACISVRQYKDGLWRVIEVQDSPDMMADILTAAGALAGSSRNQGGDVRYIQFSGIDMAFAGRMEAEDIALASVYDIPQFGLKAATVVSASKLFGSIRNQIDHSLQDHKVK